MFQGRVFLLRQWTPRYSFTLGGWPIAWEGKSTENISAFLMTVNGLFVRFSVTSCVFVCVCVSARGCRCCSYRWWITVDEGILTHEQSAVLFADNSRAERHCCFSFYRLGFAKTKWQKRKKKGVKNGGICVDFPSFACLKMQRLFHCSICRCSTRFIHYNDVLKAEMGKRLQCNEILISVFCCFNKANNSYWLLC